MTILFPNLLTDPQEYLQAQTLWRQVFSRIESESANDTVWRQWTRGTYEDGTPIRDCGFPLFTRICRDRGQAITIRQYVPGEEWNTGEIFHASMEPSGEFGEIDTLDISCVLTEDSLAQAEALIRLYMVDDLPPEEMELHLGTAFPTEENTTSAECTLVLASLHYGLRKHFCALRGAGGACQCGFDFTPSPGLVINMDMRFSAPDGSNLIRIVVQGALHDNGVRLSYNVRDAEGGLLAAGPSAAMSVGMDANEDSYTVEDWLNAINQFAADNRKLVFRQ